MKNTSRTLLFACIGACVSLPALAAPQGFEWFPRTPGPDDAIYLIPIDGCTSESLYSVHDLTATFAERFLMLRYKSGMVFCIPQPPSMLAVAIPSTVDGESVDYLDSVNEQTSTRYENGVPVETTVNKVSWLELLPTRVAIPPAIAGTWFAPTHAEQGLLINMTAKRELLVGWTTYGADGKQRWFSGIAPTVSDEATVTVALTDTGDGAFAGQLPNDAPQKDWGTLTIEYVACGEIEVSWNPKTNTGLQPGTATMQQLTQPHDAACDIKAYAAALGQPLTIHELEIETAPRPAN